MIGHVANELRHHKFREDHMVLPVRSVVLALPVRSVVLALPVRSVVLALPVRSVALALPVRSVVLVLYVSVEGPVIVKDPGAQRTVEQGAGPEQSLFFHFAKYF